MPHLFVINKMDRPGADFDATLAALQSAYGRHVVAEQLPIGNAELFNGYVDLAELKAWRFDGDRENEDAIPADASEPAQKARLELLEARASSLHSRRSSAISARSARTTRSFRY
jgi:elongation factor G